MRPLRRCGRLSRGGPCSGSDTSWPWIGSAKPSTVRSAAATIRVSTVCTLDSSPTASASRSGARFRLTNTSAKRYRS